MAAPTAPTEAGSAKLHFLSNSTATTPEAKLHSAIEEAVSGEATLEVGWSGIATHRQGDKLKGTSSDGPGGFDTDGAGPVVCMAGIDNPTANDPVQAVAVVNEDPTSTEWGMVTRDHNLANFISTNNSTVATLGGAGNFTGTADDVSSYSSISIQIDASHDSGVDGMTFEFSTDNTNWDDVYTFDYTAADGARRFQFPATAQYFRVNYTNGGTPQTHFRVQTILHKQNILTSVHRIVDNTDPDRSAQLMKAAIIAQAAGSGDFVPVQATGGGNFKVSLEEVDAGVAVPVTDNGGNLSIDLNGTNPSLNTGTVDAGTQRVTLATDVALPAGTNAIGKLAANSGVDIGDVDVLTQPARDRTTDNVGVAADTETLMNDTTALTVKYANINDNTSGNNAIVAAVAGKVIKVLSVALFCEATATNIYWNDGTADLMGDSTHLIPLDPTGAAGAVGFVLPHNPVGWFKTGAVNRPINLNLSGANDVAGCLTYVEV